MSSTDLRALVAGIAAREIWVTATPLEFGDLGDEQWEQLTAAVRAERLEPQLALAIADDANGAAPPQIEAAVSLHARAMATTLLLDRQLLEVGSLFDGAAVDFLVLKGAASAHLDRSNPSRRAYGDVDLLVSAPHIDTADRMLEAAGGRRSYHPPRADFDRRFGKGSSFRMPSGFEVDLHRTLALGPFGLAIEPRTLFAGRETFALGGYELFALDRPRRFLHACFHSVLGRARPRLVPLLDVVHTAPVDATERAAVANLAHRWRAGAVVHAALAAVVETFGVRLSPELASTGVELRATAQQRRWLHAYVGGGRSSPRLTLSAVEAIDGWRDRVDYLAAVAWPSDLSPPQAVRRLARGGTTLVRGRRR